MVSKATPPALDLRPRTVGELISLTFQLYRRYFLVLIGITLLVMGPIVVLNILGNAGSFVIYLDALHNAANEADVNSAPASVLLSLVSFCAGGLALLIGILVSWMDGALIHTVVETILGRSPTWRQAYQAARPRWGALWLGNAIRTVVLMVLIVPLVFAVYAALYVGLIGTTTLSTPSTGGSGSGLLQVGLLAFCLPLSLAWGAVGIYVAVSWSMIEPAIVSENLSGGVSLGRSSELVSGFRLRLTGRLFLFEVMRFVIVILPLMVVQLFVFNSLEASAATINALSSLGLLAMILGTVVGSVAQVLVAPLYMIYITLNYLDLRVRKENLDLQMKAMQASASPITLVAPAPATGIQIAPIQSGATLNDQTTQVAMPSPNTLTPPPVQTPTSPPSASPSEGQAAAPPVVTGEPTGDLSTLTPAQRASVLFRRLRTEGPSAELLNELGLAYQQIGDTYGALDALTRARTLAPNDAVISYNLAIVQRTRRDYGAARHAMADYLRLEKDPDERERVLHNPAFKDILPLP